MIASPPSPQPLSSTPPLLAWLGPQIAALSLAACRVPLWAQAPQAGELFSLQIVLITQLVSASLLFPTITQDFSTTLLVIASAWPFIVLAGLLAAVPFSTVLLAIAYFTSWLTALWLWSLPLSSTRLKLIASSVFSTWSAAGPLLFFVKTEYGTAEQGPAHLVMGALSGPVSAVYLFTDGQRPVYALVKWVPQIVAISLATLVISLKWVLFTRTSPVPHLPTD